MKRQLTGFEKVFCLSEPQVPMNFSFVVRFSEAPEQSRLQDALLELRKRYPLASSRMIQDGEGQLQFTDEGASPFPLKIFEHADIDWQEVTVNELGELFNLKTGPLARFAILDNKDGSADLILTFHHGISDGMSAVFFLEDLLMLMAGNEESLSKIPETPDLDQLILADVRKKILVKIQLMVMKAELRMVKFMNRFGLGFPPADRLIQGKHTWEHITLTTRCLTAAQTKILVDRCKEKGTSVHAAVSVAWLRARNELIDNGKWKRKISTPVNLRGNLGLGNIFGMIMSNAIVALDCSPGLDFWEIARKLKTGIVEEIDSGRIYQWLAKMYGMTNMPEEVIKQAVPSFVFLPLEYDFSMSNVGKLRLSNAEHISAIYGPIVNTSEKELTVGVSTIHNQLTMSLIYRDFILSKEIGEKIADRALNLLGAAVGWEDRPDSW